MNSNYELRITNDELENTAWWWGRVAPDRERARAINPFTMNDRRFESGFMVALLPNHPRML
jgi:hypothetical protein